MKKFDLHIKKVSAGYQTPLLQHIDLKAQEGEMIGLLGKNGAGKSTFLKSLAGIIPLHAGAVYFKGQNILQMSKPERALTIGIVLSGRIDMPVKVIDFLKMGRYMHAPKIKETDKNGHSRIEKVIADLHLEALLAARLNELSDGEHQKVMIGRVLVQDTPVILLDEPTTHLDMENKALILNLLQTISRTQNKIIVLSTHDINLVLPKVDKLWLARTSGINEISWDDLSGVFQSPWLQFDEKCRIFRLV